jgi:hypothetical protein
MGVGTVNYKRKEVVEAEKRYSVIRDCLAGEIAVKAKKSTYLPIHYAADKSTDNTARYAAYIARATFYNVTKRTLDGLCGQIFVRQPVAEVPAALLPVLSDADGGGVSLTQMSKEAVQFVLGYGRMGLFVDYPERSGGATKAELDAGDVRPAFTIYAASQVINWRTIVRGARKLLALVVLEETYITDDDGFEAVEAKQWRVLRLVNDIYTVEIWRSDSAGVLAPSGRVVPTDASGAPFREIPFTFVGARNNDTVVDEPPMYDIASLNIAHYRNSADYEESAFMVGQPTPVFSGLTEDWVTNVLKGQIVLGSRGSVALPPNGTAALLQASPNSMPFEAMQHKEKQMVALGARLVEQRSVTRTATETNKDASTESSVLASAAKNVAAALTWGLKWAAAFMGVDGSDVSFSLNTDFDIATMSPEDRRQLITEWQAGALSWEEVRGALRKSGVATLDDASARERIDEELATLPQMPATSGQPSATKPKGSGGGK